MRHFVAFLICCILLIAAWIALVLDDLLAASWHPAFVASFVLLGIIAGAFMILARYTPLLVAPGAYMLFILTLPFIEHTPTKPAVRAVDEIQPGMTKQQVRNVIDRNFPENSRFKRPVVAESEDVLLYSLDPNDPAYNASLIVVKFADGKVSSAKFLPD